MKNKNTKIHLLMILIMVLSGFAGFMIVQEKPEIQKVEIQRSWPQSSQIPFHAYQSGDQTYTCEDEPRKLLGSFIPDEIKSQQSFERALKLTDALNTEFTKNNNLISEQNRQAFYMLAKTRKTAMIDAMHKAPGIARQALFTTSVNNSLINALKEFTTNCVEEPASAEGIFSMQHNHYYVNDSFDYLLSITDSNGQKTYLYTDPKNIYGISSGDKVSIAGAKINNELFALSIKKTEQENLKVQSADTQKTYKYLLPMLYFQDQSKPQTTVQNVQNAVNKTNDFYLENSYGKLGFEGVILDWIQLPIKSICDSDIILEQSLPVIKQKRPEINFNNFDGIYFILDYPGYTGCSNGGGGSLGKEDILTPDGVVRLATGWSETETLSTMYVISHEFGHNLGRHHANSINCGAVILRDEVSECDNTEYGDNFAIMGPPWPVYHDNVYYKELENFLSENENIQLITQNGRYTISPMASNSAGIKGLKIPRYKGFLYIEYRQPIGWDKGGEKTNIYNGALLHVGDANTSYIFDPIPPFDFKNPALPVGSTFVDPTSKTEIKAVSKTADQLVVDIKLGKTDYILPDVQLTQPSGNISISNNTSLTATAEDNESILKVEFLIKNKEEKEIKLIGVDFTAPYTSLLIPSNYALGDYELWARTYDTAGEAYQVNNNYKNSSKRQVLIFENNGSTPSSNVQFTSPANGAVLSKNKEIAIRTINIPVTRAELYIDASSSPLTVFTNPPFTYSLQTENLKDGSHLLRVKAYDSAGNVIESSVSVIIDNNAPIFVLENPGNMRMVTGKDYLVYGYADAEDTDYVEFYLNNKLIETVSSNASMYRFYWDTTKIANGRYQLYAIVYDTAGNSKRTPVHSIIVQN